MIVEQNGGPKAGQTDAMRSAVRFPISIPVHVETEEGFFDAVTDNISACGLLFGGAVTLVSNTRLRLTLTMPAEVMGTSKDLLIQCLGRVVRQNGSGKDLRTAATIDEYFLKA